MNNSKIDYAEYRLGELADLKNGLNFANSEKKIPCKIIGVGDFGNNVFPNYKTLGTVEKDNVSEDFLLKENDIIFVRSNGNKNLVGRTMMIKNIQENITFSGFCIRLRVKEKAVNSDYLF